MAFLGGLVGKILGIVLLVVVLLIAAGVYAYATDYGVEASVVSKKCAESPPTVTVKTKVGGLAETVQVGVTECGVIQPGNFVVYHIRSERTIIYQSEGGKCLFDTLNKAC